MVRSALPLAAALALVACDGTLSGLGRTPLLPEPPLPAAPIEPATPRGEPAEPTSAEEAAPTIGAQHLLVAYAGSRMAGGGITRTKQEARARADQALGRARAGEDFGKLVVEYTDEPGGGARRGDLGRFSRERMVKPFADAAFALKTGEVSGVVETPFGYHVIKRTE